MLVIVMSETNKVKSISVLPSTVAEAFNSFFLSSISNLKYCVFDPALTYETSIPLIRAGMSQRNKLNYPKGSENKDKIKNIEEDKDIFPFISWNRSQLGKNTLGNAKNISSKVFNEENGKYYNFDGGNSDFTYNFSIFSKSPIDIERIEVLFSSGLNKYFSNFTNMYLTIQDIGKFMYNLVWNQTETINFNITDNYYQCLTGSVTVCGLFFTIEETDDSGIITDIEFNIGSCCGIISEDHYSIKSQEDI